MAAARHAPREPRAACRPTSLRAVVRSMPNPDRHRLRALSRPHARSHSPLARARPRPRSQLLAQPRPLSSPPPSRHRHRGCRRQRPPRRRGCAEEEAAMRSPARGRRPATLPEAPSMSSLADRRASGAASQPRQLPARGQRRGRDVTGSPFLRAGPVAGHRGHGPICGVIKRGGNARGSDHPRARDFLRAGPVAGHRRHGPLRMMVERARSARSRQNPRARDFLCAGLVAGRRGHGPLVGHHGAHALLLHGIVFVAPLVLFFFIFFLLLLILLLLIVVVLLPIKVIFVINIILVVALPPPSVASPLSSYPRHLPRRAHALARAAAAARFADASR